MTYRYDPETGGFVPVKAEFTPPKHDPSSTSVPEKKKGDNDVASWILIGLLFAFGLWPIGLIALISKLRDSPRRKYTAAGAERTHEKTEREASSSADAETKAAVKTPSRATKAAQKMTRSPNASSRTANVLTIVGLCVMAIFGMGLLGTIGDAIAYGWFGSVWEDIFITSGFFMGGIVTLVAGWKMKKRTKRMVRYLAFIGDRPYVSISEMSAVVGKKAKTVERDLEFMIEKGMLGGLAYIDSGRGILFRSAEAAQQYAKEQSGRENLTPREANEGYAGVLRSIRYANDRIPDPVLSEKIDRLEVLAGRILSEIEAHPEKQPQASKFMNYYLPTTLKLLDSYAQFDAAGIEGENLRQAKSRIADTFDNLIANFERQLDDLYSNEARDIDSDIRVMETMLNADSASVERDFGLNTAARKTSELDLGGVAAQQQDE